MYIDKRYSRYCAFHGVIRHFRFLSLLLYFKSIPSGYKSKCIHCCVTILSCGFMWLCAEYGDWTVDRVDGRLSISVTGWTVDLELVFSI